MRADVHVVDATERAVLEDLFAAADDQLRTALRLQPCEIDGAFVAAAAALPASAIVVNRAIDLGMRAPATRETVDRLVRHYARAGVARYFVHVHTDARPSAMVGWLEAHGLERARGWTAFTRGREAVGAAETNLTIRPANPADAAEFGRIVCDAFDLGEGAAPWLGRLIGRPGWHVYMSFDGELPAGTGALFVRDGVGWLDWGATAPAFRKRGSQSALLRRRIADALDLGCYMIATETGESVPGDPQHSYHNIRRAGFSIGHTRANFAPPRDPVAE